MKYKIGDKVIITGELYYSSNDLRPKSYIKDKKTTITRVVSGARHPYNSTGDLGWCDEKSIKYQEEPVDKTKYEMEVELIDINGLLDYLKENKNKVLIIKSEDLERVINSES